MAIQIPFFVRYLLKSLAHSFFVYFLVSLLLPI